MRAIPLATEITLTQEERQAPPDGYANWTAPLLARELGDIHEQSIIAWTRTSA